jgi:hypothetical protein
MQFLGIGIVTRGLCDIFHNVLQRNDVGIGCYWSPYFCTIIESIIQGNSFCGIYCIAGSQLCIYYNNIFHNTGGVTSSGG